MNAEEVTIKIKVSEDVRQILVGIVDENRVLHNKAGTADKVYTNLEGRNDWVLTTQNHYLHGELKTREEFQLLTSTPKEMTVEEIEKLLGFKVKVIGG